MSKSNYIAQKTENTLAIFVNDPHLKQPEYENFVLNACAAKQRRVKAIRTLNPGTSKKGNLVFVEFYSREDAEFVKCELERDAELLLKPTWARPSTNQSQTGQSKFNSNTTNARPQQQRQQNGHGLGLLGSPPSDPNFFRPTERPAFQNKRQVNGVREPNASGASGLRLPKAISAKTSFPKTLSPKPSLPKPEIREVESEKPPELELPLSGPCTLCCKTATMRCQRCGDFYCSKECQAVDWIKHKPMCFPMPGLVSTMPSGCLGSKSVPSPTPSTTSVSSAAVCKEPSPVQPFASSKSPAATTLTSATSSFATNSNEIFDTYKNVREEHERVKREKEQKLQRVIRFCPSPPSGTEVFISWPASTNVVYIVSREKSLFEEYTKVLEWAETQGKTARNLIKCPEVGDLVLGNFDDCWARGLVQKVSDPSSVLVAFLEFGNIELIEWRKLKEFNAEGDLCRYTFRVFLKNCVFEDDAKAKSYLKRLADGFTPLILKYDGEFNRKNQILLFERNGKCVNDFVCELMGQKPEPTKLEEAHVWSFDSIESFDVESSQKTNIIILNNEELDSGTIMFALESCKEKLESIQSRVNRYAQGEGKNNVHKPQAGELCVVPDEERNWQRAVMIEPKESQFYSIDFLVAMYVKNPKDILRFDSSLAEKVYSFVGAIVDFPDKLELRYVEQLKKKLDKASVWTVDRITKIIENGEEKHLLYMPQLVSEVLGQ